MSKYSRNYQFSETFGVFMDTIVKNTDIQRMIWGIELLTKNTRESVHEYKLIIPATYIAYYIDVPTTNVDGTIEPPGERRLPQVRPTVTDLEACFQQFFGPFEYTRRFRKTSYVSMEFHDFAPHEDMVADIRVVYTPGYIPYPTKPTPMQEMMYRLSDMERRAIQAEEECIALRMAYDTVYEQSYINEKVAVTYVKNYSTLAKTFSTKMREWYPKGEPTDCPICYDKITLETIQITRCAHLLCNACAVKCTKCPICRDKY